MRGKNPLYGPFPLGPGVKPVATKKEPTPTSSKLWAEVELRAEECDQYCMVRENRLVLQNYDVGPWRLTIEPDDDQISFVITQPEKPDPGTGSATLAELEQGVWNIPIVLRMCSEDVGFAAWKGGAIIRLNDPQGFSRTFTIHPGGLELLRAWIRYRAELS